MSSKNKQLEPFERFSFSVDSCCRFNQIVDCTKQVSSNLISDIPSVSVNGGDDIAANLLREIFVPLFCSVLLSFLSFRHLTLFLCFLFVPLLTDEFILSEGSR